MGSVARLFPSRMNHAGDQAMREDISRRRNDGETLAQLAKRFRSSRVRISRILARQRLEQVQELELDYIPNEHFTRTSAAEERDARPGPGESTTGQGGSAAHRAAVLPGEHLRDSAPDAGTGAASVPQDELPEAQGQRAPQPPGHSPSQHDGDGADPEVLQRGARRQERHRPRQFAIGGVDRQAICQRPGSPFRADQ